MSIKSELNKAVSYLQDTKKAIEGRGGILPLKSGFKDLPDAIWNIPTNDSLTFLEVEEVSYIQTVPSDVAKNALVKSLGGMSYKSKNLFDIYRTDFVALNQLTLNNYQPKAENGVMYSGGVTGASAGAHIAINLKPNTDYFISFDAYWNTGTETSVTIQPVLIPNIENSLYVESAMKVLTTLRTQGHYGMTFNSGNYVAFGIRAFSNNKYGIAFSNVQLEEGTTETTYKQFFEGLRDTKPTSFESRGANLLDIYRTDYIGASDYALGLKPKAENGILYSGGLRGHAEGAGIPIYLKPNTDYTFSCDIKTNDANPVVVLRLISNTDENGIFNQAESLVVLSYAKTGHCSKTFNSGTYKAVVLLAFSETIYGTELTNVRLNYGTTEAPYKPFSAEPIDTKELPEAVQSLDGWGLGIDAEYNNHIVWRNGRVIYIQMLDEFDLSNVGEWVKAYAYFYTFPYKSPAMKDLDMKIYDREDTPIGVCSHYGVASTSRLQSAGIDKAISYNKSDTQYINIRDTTYTDVDTFKEAMKGVKLVYALETPIETDITHLFTDTSQYLKVESGGTITFHNEHGQAVPSKIKYIRKVGI